jgi:hypothetical protein
VRGQQEVDPRARAAAELRRPPPGPCADAFQQQLDQLPRRQRDQGLDPRLLEAEHRVAQDIQDRDRDGEASQRGEAVIRSR